MVVAHGALGFLPLSVLPTKAVELDPEKEPLFSNYRSVPWLARSHGISMLPSVTSLRILRSLPKGDPSRKVFTGFGNPYFTLAQASEKVEETIELLEKEGLEPSIVIDCSHSNSGKNFHRQERVLRSVFEQKLRKNRALIGFMIESNIVEGSQDITEGKENLIYGCSVTDACVGWEETEEILLSGYEKLQGGI